MLSLVACVDFKLSLATLTKMELNCRERKYVCGAVWTMVYCISHVYNKSINSVVPLMVMGIMLPKIEPLRQRMNRMSGESQYCTRT